MKKARKQVVLVEGKKVLVDVPVDQELHKMDSREDYMKRRIKMVEVGLEGYIERALAYPVDVVDAEELYDDKETANQLREALGVLSFKERTVIMLIFYKGFTEREVGKILGITQQAVNSYKQKALRKLKVDLTSVVK